MARKRGLKLRIPLTFMGILVILAFLGGAFVLGLGYIMLAEGIDERISLAAMAAFVAVCIAGAVVGLLHGSGLVRIYLKCPFCKEYAQLDFRHQEGFVRARPVLECANCGRLVNVLRFGVRVERERTSVCPECGYEFEKGGSGPESPRCPECGWSEKAEGQQGDD